MAKFKPAQLTMGPVFIFMLLCFVPHALGGFHLFTRYQRSGTWSCERRQTCSCKFDVEWRMGAVPAQNYNCNAFMNDAYFPQLIEAGASWNTHFPGICGSKAVDMYIVNGGNNLEVWESGANPGKLLAKCYKQNANTITCGNPGDPLCPTGKTEVHDVWVCAETNLCS
jgi:hypothetical protein